MLGRIHLSVLCALTVPWGLFACGTAESLPAETVVSATSAPEYRVGPGDTLQVFVWRNDDLSVTVPVRPDGRISVPLIEDLDAAGKTPTELASDIEERLSEYIQDPLVTVMVTGFVGTYTQQVRIIGEAAVPQAIPYRDAMTLLDIMITVGGMTPFAAGNRSTIVRVVDGEQKTFNVRLKDLLKDGDVSANVPILPGDVLIIPEAWF